MTHGFAKSAVGRLGHRGPDASGVACVTLPWCQIELGMSRLKIVDQSDITVPFDFSKHLGVLLAFNGEIYNWRDIRNTLDVPWATSCDAEVVAAAWRQYGPNCLHKLNGMWGMILVDTWKHEIFISRDRAGEKPLYWVLDKDSIYVASEPKALPVSLVECQCQDVDVLEFDCGITTPLKGINAVSPGGYIHLCNAAQPNEVSWWQLPMVQEDNTTLETAVNEVEATLVDAIKIRYIAERPVAVQLSGGLDSAIVQAVVRSNRLYCVTFSDVDNLSMAKAAAFSEQVVPVKFSVDDLMAILPTVAYYLDTPATWTAVCQWFLNQRAREDGNIVVLSGEGADELFGGYSRYRILYWVDKMLSDGHLAAYAPLVARTFSGDENQLLVNMLNRGGQSSRRRAEDLINEFGGIGTLAARMARVDFYTTMRVLLRMADRMASAFGMENRSPFFDYRVMELAARLPDKFKINDDESKVVLRRVAERLGVDGRIVNEKTKKGLFIPPSWGKKLNGGQDWDRKWFTSMMLSAWREMCLRQGLDCIGD